MGKFLKLSGGENDVSLVGGDWLVSSLYCTQTQLLHEHTRDSEWQWHQLGHMQVCTSLQTDNHASTPPLSFLQAGCPTNSVKALKELKKKEKIHIDNRAC